MKRYLTGLTTKVLRETADIKPFICILVVLGSVTLSTVAEKPKIDWSQYPVVWHVCQDCGMVNRVKTINEAIAAARPGDIINIWGEETYAGLIDVYEYEEAIVIDKRLILTCDNPHPELGFPIITQRFTNAVPKAVITVLPGGEGTVIRNLRIRGPISGPVTDCESDLPFDCMMTKAGIRIEANGCRVQNCTITRCMTGVVITGHGNSVVESQLGDRWRDIRQGIWAVREEWSATERGQTIDHPGNGFGIVIMAKQDGADDPEKSPADPNTTGDNIFRGIRYTETVEIPLQ